jgi:hypothetical protein
LQRQLEHLRARRHRGITGSTPLSRGQIIVHGKMKMTYCICPPQVTFH